MSATATFFSDVTLDKNEFTGFVFGVKHPETRACQLRVWVPDIDHPLMGNKIMPIASHNQEKCRCPEKIKSVRYLATLGESPLVEIGYIVSNRAAQRQEKLPKQLNTWTHAITWIAAFKREFGITRDTGIEHLELGVNLSASGEFILTLDVDSVE